MDNLLGKPLNNRKIVLWGVGSYLKTLLPFCKKNSIAIEFFADSKIRGTYEGKPILNGKELNRETHFVIISSIAYANDIAKELAALGFSDSDYILGSDLTTLLRRFVFDREINGVQIGRFSYCAKKQLHIAGNASTTVESIGRFTSINDTAEIWADHSDAWISTGVLSEWIPSGFLVNAPHAHNYPNPSHRVTIGNDVWIAHNAFINCGKVKSIGDGAIIAAGAIVLEDVPPYSVVAGVPAKIKKYRYSEKEIEILLRTKWWDFTDQQRDMYADCLTNPSMFFEKFR